MFQPWTAIPLAFSGLYSHDIVTLQADFKDHIPNARMHTSSLLNPIDTLYVEKGRKETLTALVKANTADTGAPLTCTQLLHDNSTMSFCQHDGKGNYST
jgi:hypothetical protein